MFEWIAEYESGLDKNKVYEAVASGGDKIYTFGCENPASPMEVNVLNTLTMEWTVELPNEKGEKAPSFRWGHSAVAYGDLVYIWGGYSVLVKIELYTYNTLTSKWRKIITEGQPPYRYCHSACLYGNRMYIIGGYDSTRNQPCSDVYYLDLDSHHWHHVQTTGVPPVHATQCAVAVINKKMFLYLRRKLFYLDLTNYHWEGVCVEGIRDLRTISFVYRNELYFFSSVSSFNGYFNEIMYCVDPDTFELQRKRLLGSPPRTRLYHECLVVKDRLYMIGGTILHGRLGAEKHWNAGTLVLDLIPMLQTFAIQTIVENKMNIASLPKQIQNRVYSFSTSESKKFSEDQCDCGRCL